MVAWLDESLMKSTRSPPTPFCVYVRTLKSVIAFQLMDKWEFHPCRAIVWRHLWLVSLYIGLQAVFIIFHYSCFVHDCTRRALIGFVGVEVVEMFDKLRLSGSLAQMSRPFSEPNIFQKEPKRSYRNGTKSLHENYSWHLFLYLQNPAVPAGIELSPCLKCLLLLFNTAPPQWV